MTGLEEARKNLYDNLIEDGYFQDADGSINFLFDDFCQSLDDSDVICMLYHNLLEDGYFRDDQGVINFTEGDFIESVGKKVDIRIYYPITENQRGIYFDWVMNREAVQYNIPGVEKIDTIDVQSLQDALQKVVNAHPYIKTHFAIIDGDTVQLNRNDEPVKIDYEWIDYEPDAPFFQRRVRPFDLLNDNLYRLEIYQTPVGIYLFHDFHHAIFDGGSNVIFLQELRAKLAGEEIDSELYTAFQFAIDEQYQMQSAAYSEAEEFFDQLIDDVAVGVYPHSTKSDGVGRLRTSSITIGKDIIDSFCSEQGVTVNSYFLAVFMQVLHRVTRERKLQITTIYHGREDVRMQNILGMFVKTVPIVSAFNLDQLFVDSIKAIQQQFLDVISRSFYPFTRMVERHHIRPEILYVFNPFNAETTQLETSKLQLALDIAKVPLTLHIAVDGENSYRIEAKYNDSIYDNVEMQRLVKSIKNLSMSAIKSEMKVGDLQMLDNDGLKDIVRLSTGDILYVDENKTCVQLFEERVALSPNNVCVVDKKGLFTYREMSEKSTVLAQLLLDSGVKPNDFVCVMLERQKEFPLSVLAIHKVAAAYTPLDIEYPIERIQYMMEDSESKILITSHEVFAKKLEEGNITAKHIIYIDDLDLSQFAEPICLATADNLAYMIYTSGSTGKPKGVMLSHRGLTNFIVSTVEINELTSSDRISSHRSFSFDAHIEDFYPVMTVGGSVHIMPSEIRKDLNSIYRFLIEHHITGGGYTTSIATLLLQNYNLEQRFITVGGEKLHGVVSDRVQIINVYGPTECTDHTNVYKLERGRIYNNIPIGRPVNNCYCFVVGIDGQLVPQGIAGELCFAGSQVGRGYWHLDEKTSEVFTECPFIENLRMYHTGDLVRYNDEGLLEYLGRIDNQVKLRGFRIELGEIEEQVSKMSGIRQVAAAVCDINGAKHLVLYYTTNGDYEISVEILRQHVESTSLAEYMRPEIYIHLDVLPLLPNGKIDRRTLPEPKFEVDEIIDPENEREQLLFDIVTDLLKHNHFGVTTNLISVGLTSLLAMRFSACIQNKTGQIIPVKDVLKQSTIRKIASLMVDGNSSEVICRSAYPKQRYYPITENQRGVYVDWEMNRDALQYNMPSVVKLTGWDAEKLCDVLKAFVNAHSYLKMHLAMYDNDIMQRRLDEEEVQISLTLLDEEPTSTFFQSRVLPFNLFSDCLYRLEVYQTPTTIYLFKDFHHILFDGLSSIIMTDEFTRAYNGETLVVEDYSAFDFALDEQVKSQSEAYNEAMCYFDDLLDGAESAVLPHSGEILKSSPKANAYVDRVVNRTYIDEYCQRHALTANSFFITVLMQVLHRIIREEHISITTISNGRSDTAMERIVGMFVKTIPIVSKREKKDSSRNFAEISSEIQTQLFESQARDFYPFTKVVERAGIRPNIMFIFQGGMQFNDDARVALSSTEGIEVDRDTVKVPVSVMIAETFDGCYHINIEYSAKLYNEQDITLLLDSFVSFIDYVLDENIKLIDIPLVRHDCIETLVHKSFGGLLSYNADQTFVTRCLEYASIQPEAIAVVDGGGSLSYDMLDKQSRKLAHTLISLGLKPGDFVCVMMGRQKEYLVAILGIMRAGGAYVPLDREYPMERLQYMLQDSGAKILVTTQSILETKNSDDSFSVQYVIDVDQLLVEAPMTSLLPINNALPENPAYMIYTSGSTGLPKGVVQPHRSLSAFLSWRQYCLELTKQSRLAQHASFSFDASLDDLFSSLAVGGSVYIMSEDLRKDLTGMYEYFKDNYITGLTLSTQMGMTLLNAFNDLSLKFLMMGGEKLLPFQPTNIKVINGYGPTEFTVCSSFHVVDQNKDRDIPIGRPVPNTWSFICDPYGNLLPQGAVGELCLSGPQIALGYWNKPEMTAEKFVDCKYTSGKMYRTGDLARYNADGELEFWGRIDNMVKLRGFRIELGEIESKAAMFQDMRDIAAEVKTISAVQHLILYFTANAVIDTHELRVFMAQSLTDYMVPTVFMQLEEMPLTPNGKINHKALPIPTINQVFEAVRPETQQEERLMDIVEEVLQITGFGVTDDLRNIGMTSLIAIKIVLAAQKYNIAIKVGELLKYGNIRDLLKASHNLFYLANERSEGKPIIVIILGVSAYKYAAAYIEALSKHFTVYAIESIIDHYEYLFNDSKVDEVAMMYATLIETYLMPDDQVYAITGHSFGGEMAYRVAAQWHIMSGQTPAVMMLDTIWSSTTTYPTPLTNLVPHIPESVNDYMRAEFGGTIADLEFGNRVVGNLMLVDVPESYDAPIILQRAMVDSLGNEWQQMEEAFEGVGEEISLLPENEVNAFKSRYKADNEMYWKNYVSGLICHHIDDTHMGILKPQYAELFANELYQVVLDTLNSKE